jgi:hypothetical protein
MVELMLSTTELDPSIKFEKENNTFKINEYNKNIPR